jgi:hypothetical protein
MVGEGQMQETGVVLPRGNQKKKEKKYAFEAILA